MWDNAEIVGTAVAFTIVSELQAMVCSYLGLTTLVVTRNFEMVLNLVFLAAGIGALCICVPVHRMLHFNVFVTSTVVSAGLLLTGCIGVLAACQRKEGCFIFYGVAGFLNFFALIAGGGLLLIYGGAFSHADYVTTAQFCTFNYPNVDCTCGLGADLDTCITSTCINATRLDCADEIEAALALREGYFTELPLDRCLVYALAGERCVRASCRDAAAAAAAAVIDRRRRRCRRRRHRRGRGRRRHRRSSLFVAVVVVVVVFVVVVVVIVIVIVIVVVVVVVVVPRRCCVLVVVVVAAAAIVVVVVVVVVVVCTRHSSTTGSPAAQAKQRGT